MATTNYLPTQFFYFYSALSTDTPLGLCVDSPTANVVLQPWMGGQAEELWVLIDNGSTFALQSALSITSGTPQYLAVSGSSVVVQSEQWGWRIPPGWNNSSDSENILPDFQVRGAIRSQDSEGALTVQNGDPASGTPIVVDPHDDHRPEHTWAIFPAVLAAPPQPFWTRLATTLVDDEKNKLVLDVQDPLTPTHQLLLNTENNDLSQFWMVSPAGYILNGIGSTNMLQTRGSFGDGGYIAGIGGFNSTTAQWSLNAQGLITSPAYPNIALSTVTSPASGTAVNFLPIPESGPTKEMVFTIDPPPTLEPILAQPPEPFPRFSGQEAIAFEAINHQLGYRNIRMQYLNQSISLSLSTCKQPKDVDATAWSAVIDQLQTEIDYVASVNKLFAAYDDFNTNALLVQSTKLQTLVNDAGLASGTDTSGVPMAVFTNLFFPLLGMIPGCAPVAILGRAALSGATAVKHLSATPFNVAVDDLWDTLSGMFNIVAQQLAVMQTAVLSDWGKLQAMNTAISGPLAIPPSAPSQFLSTITDSFTVAAMQILLPARFQLYTYQEPTDEAVPDMSDYEYATNVVPLPFAWQASWIAERNDWSVYPTATALQTDVFDITKQDWFTDTLSAWPFAVCWVYGWNGASVENVIVTVTNQTPEMLTLSVDSGSQVLAGTFASTTVALPFNPNTGVSSTVAITDITGKIAIASFTVTMQAPNDNAPLPQVSGISCAAGYGLSSPQCNAGLWRVIDNRSYPGTVQITLSLA